MSLVALDPLSCPGCGAELTDVVWSQPALLRHGGYGATRETVLTACCECNWSMVRSIQDRAPGPA